MLFDCNLPKSFPDHEEMSSVRVDSISKGDIIVITPSHGNQVNYVVYDIFPNNKFLEKSNYQLKYYQVGNLVTDMSVAPNEPFDRRYNVRRKKCVVKNVNNFPHSCPKCKGAAYIGLNKIECSVNNCFS